MGENGSKKQSYISVLSRQKVKITYKTWKVVPDEVEDMIWEAVNLLCNVHPCRKMGCLASTNAKWCQFKAKLTNEYIVKNLNNSAELNKTPTKYNIEQSDWSEFVISRVNKDFLKLREENQARRALYKHPCRLSRKRYARFMLEISKELCDDPEINRAILWIRSREKNHGSHLKDKEFTAEVTKINHYIKERREGRLPDNGWRKGILSRGLESEEHGGRVRGVGGNVT